MGKKKSGLDWSQFKKVQDDGSTATLRHPGGHHVTVAKYSLSKEMRQQISDLPLHLDKGGEVQDPNATPEKKRDLAIVHEDVERLKSQQQSPADGKAETFQTTRQPYGGYAQGGEVIDEDPLYAMDPQAAAQAALPNQGPGGSVEAFLKGGPAVTDAALSGREPTPDERRVADYERQQSLSPSPQPMIAADAGPAVMPQAAASPAAIPTGGSSDPAKAVQQGQAGLRQEAEAKGVIGAEQAAVQTKLIDHMSRLEADHQLERYNLQQEQTMLQRDFDEGHIDPRRLWNSKSTGAKIGATIGVILGGIGAGLTGGENGALKLITGQIDQDIESQKTDLHKKETLLRHNLQKFHDLDTATAATKLQLMTVAEAQMKRAAALSASPLAKAEYLKHSAALQLQYAPLMEQVAQRQAVRRAMQSGGMGDPRVAGLAVQALVPKEHQAEAMKQLTAAQNIAAQEKNIMTSFDQAAKENSITGRVMRGGFEPPSVKAFNLQVMGPLKDIEGRVNETEIHVIQQLAPAPGDSTKTLATKRLGLQRFLSSKKSSPLLQAYGITAGAPASTGGINFTPAKR